MKWIFNLPKLAWATLALSSVTVGAGSALAQASQFTETALDQTQVIAIARPYGVETTKYDLLVLEQIPNKRQCWQEKADVSGPVLVDPLLLQFDFTGICRRSTDSNGYSVRIDGQDYGLEYLLRIVPHGNELLLLATSRTGKAPELVIGSTRGLAAGFMKIQLNPGWQFTKRTYNGKPLGHFYFSTTQAALFNTPVQSTPAPSTATPAPTVPPVVTPREPVPAPPPVSSNNPASPVSIPTEPVPTPPPTSSSNALPTAETLPPPAPNASNVSSPGPSPTTTSPRPTSKGPTVNDFRQF
ncbi:DUF3747 domain-containing protein [Synechocystis sp. LKSZ1]|uniref:DUF3747 domain-containing protein n=1 Tax=Synechocystis sp. LKSZ1 TaxID=3144951 RepID=UPI00336BC181